MSLAVLITGGGRGLGRSLALAFAREGHRVTVNYKSDAAAADGVAAELRALGAEAETSQADVSRPAEAQALVRRAAERWGRLDVLVNNAGIARDRTILKMTEAEWREVIETDLNGVFWCLQAAAKVMAEQRAGAIVNIASLAGARGGVGNANYAAAKAGVVGLTKTAARELGRFNVRVNAVTPGFHPTALSAGVWAKHRDRILAEHVLERLVSPDDFARLVLFLCVQESVSGQVFPVESRLA